MLGPVCDIQKWLYQDEELFGYISTKAQMIEVYKMTNGALKKFATDPAVANGLTSGVCDKLRQLVN